MFNTKGAKLNFVYSIGAAIVILGALLKVTHISIPGVSGNFVLGIGLLVEAIIFIVAAFDPPEEESKYAWENVYPELIDGNISSKTTKTVSNKFSDVSDFQESLSKKLDEMLAEAKLDVNLFERLKTGMDKFSRSVNQIGDSIDFSDSARKYHEQMDKMNSHLESINALYELQLENGRKYVDFNNQYISGMQKSVGQSEKFSQEFEKLTSNLSNLNRLYGGMLSAMRS